MCNKNVGKPKGESGQLASTTMHQMAEAEEENEDDEGKRN